MKKYKVTRTPKADTRHVDSIPTKEDLMNNSKIHIKDVNGIWDAMLRDYTKNEVRKHDWTKIRYGNKFHKDFLSRINDKTDFLEGAWWAIHIRRERHHIFDYKGKEKLTLLDGVHMCVDWISAGKARSKDGSFEKKKLNEIGEQEVKDLLFEMLLNQLDFIDSKTSA